MNALGCVNGAGTAVRPTQLVILDIEYATACGIAG